MFCCLAFAVQVYQGHTLEKTYLGEDFFWAITPTAGDYILFKFDRPVSIERHVVGICSFFFPLSFFFFARDLVAI